MCIDDEGELGVPNWLRVLTPFPIAATASCNVYGESLFALRRGLKMRERNGSRVRFAFRIVIEESVVGRVVFVFI